MKSFSTTTLLVAISLAPATLALPHQHAARHRIHLEASHDPEYAQLDVAKRATASTIALDSHVEYSSSMRFIGCLINKNRIAYFPMKPPCSDPCINSSHRTETLSTCYTSINLAVATTSAWMPTRRSSTVLGRKLSISCPKQDGPASRMSTFLWVSVRTFSQRPEGTLLIIAKGPNKYIECVASEPQSFWATHTQFHDVDDARCLRGVVQTCEMVPPNNTPTCANGRMAGMSGQIPLTDVPTVVDVTAAGEQVPAVRPAVRPAV